MNKKVISVYDDSNKRLVKNTGLFSYLYVGSYGGITMWGFIVALVSGALMSIQGVFNTEVTKQTSLWVSTGWVQLSAFAVCVLAWLFTGRESIAALWQVENKYTLLGGVIGAFDSEHGCPGTGKGSHADRCLPASCGLCDRAFWTFRCGKGCV